MICSYVVKSLFVSAAPRTWRRSSWKSTRRRLVLPPWDAVTLHSVLSEERAILMFSPRIEKACQIPALHTAKMTITCDTALKLPLEISRSLSLSESLKKCLCKRQRVSLLADSQFPEALPKLFHPQPATSGHKNGGLPSPN